MTDPIEPLEPTAIATGIRAKALNAAADAVQKVVDDELGELLDFFACLEVLELALNDAAASADAGADRPN